MNNYLCNKLEIMDKPVIIFGTGAIGRTALEIFKSNGVLVFGFLEEHTSKNTVEIDGIPVLGDYSNEEVIKEVGKSAEAFIAEDENKVREKLSLMLKEDKKVMPVNAIHSSARIPESAALGHGNLLDAGVVMGAASSMGNLCLVQAGALIGAQSKLGDLVQIGQGCNIGSDVTIGNDVFIGAGVTVVGGITIAKGARVGAGSVVIENIGAGETVFGNPAKKVS